MIYRAGPIFRSVAVARQITANPPVCGGQLQASAIGQLAASQGLVFTQIAAFGSGSVLLKPAPEEPRAAPAFSLPLLVGNGQLASAELEGKPVVINFWGSWCEPCKEELPAFQRTYDDYQDEVEFVDRGQRDFVAAVRFFGGRAIPGHSEVHVAMPSPVRV